MSNILVLKAQANAKFADPMLEAARTVMQSYSMTWDEFIIPSPNDIPVAISHYLDSKNYIGLLAIGCTMRPANDIGQAEIYSELVRQLSEFSSYYAFPVGIGVCLANSKTKMTDVVEFAAEASVSVCAMVDMIQKHNSFDSDLYVSGSKQHN